MTRQAQGGSDEKTPGSAPSRWMDLGPRMLSSLALATLAGGALIFGGIATALLTAAAAAAMGWEFRNILGGPEGRIEWFDWATPVALGLAPLFAHLTGDFTSTLSGLAAAAGVILLLDMTRRDPRFVGPGVLLIGAAAASFVFLRDQPKFGFEAAFWLVLVVAATDVGGYFAGRMIGGPRLAPTLSPGKTWSGFGGGLALAALVGALFSWGTTGTYAFQVAVVSVAAAFVAVAGDLSESALKRRFGVKDASRLIPGHGGVLDRLDGLMAAAIVAAAVTALRGKEVFVW